MLDLFEEGSGDLCVAIYVLCCFIYVGLIAEMGWVVHSCMLLPQILLLFKIDFDFDFDFV